MRFTITIPELKVGKSIPVHFLTKEDTIKILSFSVKPHPEFPVALYYEVKIVNEEREVLEEQKLTVIFNVATQLYESPPLNMVYDGTSSFFFITALPTEVQNLNTILCPVILDALLLRSSDNNGGRLLKNRPISPVAPNSVV